MNNFLQSYVVYTCLLYVELLHYSFFTMYTNFEQNIETWMNLDIFLVENLCKRGETTFQQIFQTKHKFLPANAMILLVKNEYLVVVENRTNHPGK